MKNGYICFYNRKQVEVYAETSLKAREEAAKVFKVKESKQYMISVVLAEKEGKPVTHLPLF